MAASLQLPMMAGTVQEPYHVYHAEASILKGELKQPIQQPIEPYGLVVLENTRRESLITQSVGETNIEGLISFKRGHTRVAGTHVQKKTDLFGQDHAGWVTLSSAAVEGYNVVDVVTADRVVAQLTTEHPLTKNPKRPIGHVPWVNFIGTRFENLRIGGYPVEVELDLAFCGPRPEDDRPYLQNGGFLDQVQRQLDGIVESHDLPESLEKKYSSEISYIDDLKKRAKDNKNDGSWNEASANGYPKVRCSLVKNIKLPTPIPGVSTFGNAIFIRDFGTVYLAELEVGLSQGHSDFRHRKDDPPSGPGDSNYFTLNMLDMRLGCPSVGQTSSPSAKSNGTTNP